MKQLVFGAAMLCLTGHSHAQNDGLNLSKYWKLRHDLREKFVRIGPGPGQSLPAGTLKPMDCVDNDPDVNHHTAYGEMHWGDGMIRHGHYLGLLATEYALLKRSGLDVSGVVNELYYALLAFNRLDAKAEFEQGGFYEMVLQFDGNGFFMREDVGEDFALEHWGQDPMKMACTNSAYYSNNNWAKVDDGTPGIGMQVDFNTYQNVPSLDQLTSLLVGFSLVHKLVDNIYVRPKPSDQGFQLVTETKAIVHRIMSYVSSHNWFIIDVNGWPVANGGGDLLFAAVPLSIAARRITGHLYPLETARQDIAYQRLQKCLTGFGVEGQLNETERLQQFELLTPNQLAAYLVHLGTAGQAGAFNNQTLSEFQTWQGKGTPLNDGFHSLSLKIWKKILPVGESMLDNIFDILNDQTADAVHIAPFLRWMQDVGVPDYTETIMFNLGVASQLWDQSQVFVVSVNTSNTQLELIDCVLKGKSPVLSQGNYREKLDAMPFTGPYQIKGQNWDANPDNIYQQYSFAPDGWASEYRWTHPQESVGYHEKASGIYSGIDYMLFHNLYRLVFNVNNFGEENLSCYCSSVDYVSPPIIPPANSFQLDANQNLNDKLAYMDNCVVSALSPVNQVVSGTFSIEPKFSDYVDLGIFPTKFQRTNGKVENGGHLRIRTTFVQCSHTMTIETGGKLTIEKQESQFNGTAVLDVRGHVTVKSGTALKIRGRIILRAGALLEIEDGATLELAGAMEYYDGAEILTHGSTSKILIRGTIKAMNSTTFKINTTQPANSQRGQLSIHEPAKLEAVQPSVFLFNGTGIEDNFIFIFSTFSHNQANVTLRFSDCAVSLKQGGINASQRFQAYNTKFYNSSSTLSSCLHVKSENIFNGCRFVNVALTGNFLQSPNPVKLSVANSKFSNEGFHQNAENFLISVTGAGFTIANSTFTTKTGSVHLVSTALTLPSLVENCSFSQSATGEARTVCGLSDNSNVEIIVKGCDFNGLGTGISKSFGKITLKCNTMQNNRLGNVLAGKGSLLNMTASDLAGYNVLAPPSNGDNIQLGQAGLTIGGGYNSFSDAGNYQIISGSLSTSCSPPYCILNVGKNQWNAANTQPSSSKFNLSSAQLNAMTVNVSPVFLKPACGYFDVVNPGTPGAGGITPGKRSGSGGGGENSLTDADGMPRIFLTITGDSARLDEIVAYGISRTTAADSSGDDLEAVEIFNDVFASSLDLEDPIVAPLAWQAFDHMKSALENSFYSGILTKSGNETVFDDHTSMYVNALNRLSALQIDALNYLPQFYHEFDKAHLFRIIGHPETGLAILEELESCGIDSVQQSELNYWKQVFQTELILETIPQTQGDTVIIIDTASYLQPSLVANEFSFGAQINGLNEITYPNCMYYAKPLGLKTNSVNNLLEVFPNPATDEVTIKIPSFGSGEANLLFEQSDGKMVTQLRTDLSRQNCRVKVSEWASGVYTVRLTLPDGQVRQAKFIVQ